MFDTHPYLDNAVFNFDPMTVTARQNAHDAAAMLGFDRVNSELLNAVRWGADERAQAELASRLAGEAMHMRHQQIQRAREAAAAAARAAEERRRRLQAVTLLLLADD